MPEPYDEHNPWRRLVEALALIEEATRLLGKSWGETLLGQASDSVHHSLDAMGYNSWEFVRPMAGKHEATEGSSWPGKHSQAPKYPREAPKPREIPSYGSGGKGGYDGYRDDTYGEGPETERTPDAP